MPPTWTLDDEGDHLHPREFSRADIAQIKELLAKAEEARGMHIFTEAQVKTLQSVIETFENHGEEIREMIRREQVSKLWVETRLRFWGVIKWFLATFLMIVAVVQGWQSILSPSLKWWAGK